MAASAVWLKSLLPFVVMCFGGFMALLDIQIVASSLQQIGGGLSAHVGRHYVHCAHCASPNCSPNRNAPITTGCGSILVTFEAAWQESLSAMPA
jgi:hypothetical protein